MATLNCNSCGGAIASHARRVQCPHCGELFPFACARCHRKLRPPLSEFADERHLTHDAPPRALCEEHYLRLCPGCQNWFGADENPGFFLCATCAQLHVAQAPAPEPLPLELLANAPHQGGVATETRGNPNALALAFAACGLVALIVWWLNG